MSISVGSVNLVDGILDAQYRIAVLERIVEHLIRRTPAGAITQADIQKYQAEALAEMQKRYPDAGITKK